MGCNSEQTPFGAASGGLPPEQARALLPIQVDPQDSILQVHSSGGRDQSYAFLIGSTPERIESFKRRLLAPDDSTAQGGLVKSVSRSERPKNARWRNSYPWLPSWWKADDLADREEFSIVWKRKDTGGNSRGAEYILAGKEGVIYILVWNT